MKRIIHKEHGRNTAVYHKKRQGAHVNSLSSPPLMYIYIYISLSFILPLLLYLFIVFFLPNVRKLQATRGKEARQAAGIVGRGGAIVHPEVPTAWNPPQEQKKKEKNGTQQTKRIWNHTSGFDNLGKAKWGTMFGIFVNRCFFLGILLLIDACLSMFLLGCLDVYIYIYMYIYIYIVVFCRYLLFVDISPSLLNVGRG